MASAIIPLSFQEPMSESSLDAACTSVPWLLANGFSIAFSALFTKAWRINRVMKKAVEMQRVTLRPQDVLWPFAILSCCNFIILLTWTLISSPYWSRDKTDKQDRYERSIETVGTCEYFDGQSPVFVGLLSIFNFLAIVFANYQAYVGRKNPTAFNEIQYVSLSMKSLLECFLIGGPILLVVRDHPDARYLIESILIFVTCFAILGPMFVPKFAESGHEQGRLDISDIRKALHRSSTPKNGNQNVASKQSSSPSYLFTASSVPMGGSKVYTRSQASSDFLPLCDEVQASSAFVLPSSVEALRRNVAMKSSLSRPS